MVFCLISLPICSLDRKTLRIDARTNFQTEPNSSISNYLRGTAVYPAEKQAKSMAVFLQLLFGECNRGFY